MTGKIRMLDVVDEITLDCSAIRVSHKLKTADVIDFLSDLFILRGVPGHVRSDSGPELVARAMQDWIRAVGAKTGYIELGSPWENGYAESFKARLRDEHLNGEIFYRLREVEIVIEGQHRHYHNACPPRWATGHQLRTCSAQTLPPGRLRHPKPLRRPPPP